MNPQHEHQMFFVSVIALAKTVNSIPNIKLNSQPSLRGERGGGEHVPHFLKWGGHIIFCPLTFCYQNI